MLLQHPFGDTSPALHQEGVHAAHSKIISPGEKQSVFFMSSGKRCYDREALKATAFSVNITPPYLY